MSPEMIIEDGNALNYDEFPTGFTNDQIIES